MEYRYFSRTGVRVSPLCLGTMNYGASTNEADSIRIIHAALDGGINFVDTANSYNKGASEVVTGKALKGRRDRVFLATKVRSEVGDRGRTTRACRASTSCRPARTRCGGWIPTTIDLYQLHRPEPDVPIEETLRALTDLVRAGKVRYVGSSTFPAWMVMEALATAEREHLVRLSSEQPPYNLLDRRIENELVPLALRYRVSIIPWAPLAPGHAGGPLQGRGGARARLARGAGRRAASAPSALPSETLRWASSLPRWPARTARRPGSWRCCGARTSPASPRRSSARERWNNCRMRCRCWR